MTLDKAIKELRADLLEMGERKSKELRASQRLGIEALKLNLLMRETYHAPDLLILPGETYK